MKWESIHFFYFAFYYFFLQILKQVFIETQLSDLVIFHPLTFLFREYGSDGQIDDSEIEEIYNSSTFTDFFNNNMALLKKLLHECN